MSAKAEIASCKRWDTVTEALPGNIADITMEDLNQ